MAIRRQFPPDVFRLVPACRLTKQHFELHPIWSEYYDVEERDEIVAWGVDRLWLEAELARVHTGNNHCAYPVLHPYPLPERMRLYIKAGLETEAGLKLDGYVINDDAFALAVFAGNDCFVFNVMTARHNRETCDRLRIALQVTNDPIFPIRYATDILDHEESLIAGLFTFDSEQ